MTVTYYLSLWVPDNARIGEIDEIRNECFWTFLNDITPQSESLVLLVTWSH